MLDWLEIAKQRYKELLAWLQVSHAKERESIGKALASEVARALERIENELRRFAKQPPDPRFSSEIDSLEEWLQTIRDRVKGERAIGLFHRLKETLADARTAHASHDYVGTKRHLLEAEELFFDLYGEL